MILINIAKYLIENYGLELAACTYTLSILFILLAFVSAGRKCNRI